MSWRLARPSFWPEPGDPWAWQRALRAIGKAAPVPDPRPCWRQLLGATLSRRAVAGLYGLRESPAPRAVLGAGLLVRQEGGWCLSEAGAALVRLSRDDFPAGLAETLVGRSAWLRLSLIELALGRWRLPRAPAVLCARRQIRLADDLYIPPGALRRLPDARRVLGGLYREDIHRVETRVRVEALSALHAPLYLLQAQGWIDEGGRPQLPDAMAVSLGIESPAAALRRIAGEEQDAHGFVPVARVSARLRAALLGELEDATGRAAGQTAQLAAWTDQAIGGAIEAGSIEVHAWAPGQPRHGRGLYGDRNQKLCRWTVHDDLKVPMPDAAASQRRDPSADHREVDR